MIGIDGFQARAQNAKHIVRKARGRRLWQKLLRPEQSVDLKVEYLSQHPFRRRGSAMPVGLRPDIQIAPERPDHFRRQRNHTGVGRYLPLTLTKNGEVL